MRHIYGSVMALAVAGLLSAAPAGAESITGLTASPAEGRVGDSIGVVASGKGLCGALHVDWGDGDAITYATSELPITQTHVYKTAGAFIIRARGMGNCSGEALTRVTIRPAPERPAPVRPAPDRPAPGRPARPALDAIEIAPTPAAVHTAAVITLRGSGNCRVEVDFGDGNTQTVAGELPLTLRHTYALPRRYTVAAVPQSPCTERRSLVLEVNDPDARSRVTGVQVRPVIARPGAPVDITVAGSGTCQFAVDFGDGQAMTVTAALPHQLTYEYSAAGTYQIFVSADRPCTGDADGAVRVRQR